MGIGIDILVAARLLEFRARLRAHERWTRPQLEALQQERLRELRWHAYEHSPFYQRFHQGLEHRPLGDLPVLTKRQLMDEFDEVVTDRHFRLADARRHMQTASDDQLFRDRYQLAATSGTSGEPGIFPYDPTEWAWILASYARATSWAKVPTGLTHRLPLAMIGSAKNWHQSGAVVDSLSSPWVPSLRLRSTDPLAELCAQLNDFQPRLLVTYASMAAALAGEQLGGRLAIAPQAVMCVAEPLTANTRALVTESWGAPPYENYAATETGTIAAECHRHDGMHLYEDLVIVEVVDADNRPVPAGSMGARLLVSVLFSRTLPLIRYELDDGLMLAAAPCPCGLPFRRIAKIGGRIAETLRIKRPDASTALLHPTHFEDILGLAEIRGWQVFRSADALHVRLQAPLSDAARQVIDAKLRDFRLQQRLDFLPLTVEVVDALQRTAAGKLILVQDLTNRPGA
jgi:putative adenylate-forming enzyme